MKQRTQWVLYIVLIPFTALVFYGIFNAGSPHSLFRIFVADPAYDLTITLVFGVLVAVIAISLFAGRTESPLKNILEMNIDHVRNLKSQGMSESEIAESFLQEIGSKKGMMHWIVKRRIVRHLSRLEH
ncbi:MAG TPA: hypothetical protein VMW69_01595 [Spirochaetia bacterium]|nr:hypothetical protein [Spirochaetia bacterium]